MLEVKIWVKILAYMKDSIHRRSVERATVGQAHCGGGWNILLVLTLPVLRDNSTLHYDRIIVNMRSSFILQEIKRAGPTAYFPGDTGVLGGLLSETYKSYDGPAGGA